MSDGIKFYMEIGDWSRNGHEKSYKAIATTAKTLQDVREAHFKGEEVFGFDLGKMCDEYEVYELEEDMAAKLKELGIDYEKYDGGNFYDPYDLICLWADCLNYIDPDLKLVVEEPKEPDYPTLHFSGFDEKNRHLNVPGYGMMA